MGAELRTCEVKLLNKAHYIRTNSNGTLLAANMKLEFEQVDDQTWAKRVSAAVAAVLVLSNNQEGAIASLSEVYGDILCPIECIGPQEETPGFLDCPTTGQSVYVR